MRTFVRALALASWCTLCGCPGEIPGLSSPDAGSLTSDKVLIYNLVGRWYPEDEIKRLSDRTLSAEQWCEREPHTIFVVPEKVEIRCEKSLHTAMIATAKTEEDKSITILMRAKEDSPLKLLNFKGRGPKATITGSPCFENQPIEYGRFPEYEILSREILGGRRCAQVMAPPVVPKP